ncbi:DUF3800 domain-containing protein [Planococcus lenghuensis]|uniref:DUF3800 domain-containing protein n=1 Tax=Planococcus lenghuensis TaxID=2213202 RepID=A0A1Q2L690_9BACL|nr:DUF3800 domain-containing protein [Planococcus lenghuensis]AQQ55422.1 hypothetical protein B0X71_19850 [Planococcus lenghuensis]
MTERKSFPVRIFFDESGKHSEKIHLMGAILIPSTLYELPELQELNEIVRQSDIHWATFRGHGSTRKKIEKIILTAMNHQRLMKMNVISYNQNKIQQDSQEIKEKFADVVDHTIYTKFPERVVYGLIRKYGSHSFVDAQVAIEHDNTYEAKNYDLRRQMFEQLNIQSIYRGENFKLSDVQYMAKQEEYGIELTDLLLGIVRTIIENPNDSTSGKRVKNKLILDLITESDSFYSFLNRVKLYEWGKSNDLIDAPFKNYLDIFLSDHL